MKNDGADPDGRPNGGGAVDPASFREAMSLFATGVTVITTRSGDAPVGMTASAVCSLSLEPVQLLVCVSNQLPTHAALMESGRFVVNVLGEGQEDLALRFATPGVDRFAGLDVTTRCGVPALDSAIAYFVCDIHERFPGGDHSIFIGRVIELSHRPVARPLVFYAKRFGAIAAPDDALLRSWLDTGGVV